VRIDDVDRIVGKTLRELRDAMHALAADRQRDHNRIRLQAIDHHLAHAISAYAYSGFDDAAVVVMDGRGATDLRPVSAE